MDRRRRIHATLRNGPQAWYRIVNHADADTAEVYLFDEIGWFGTTAQAFVDELKAITASRIDLHINSPGGEVFDGIAIHSTLKAHPATVTTYVDGLAASAASFIAMAGDRIAIARNGIMMIHDAAGLCIGNAKDMADFGGLLDKLSDNIADIYAQRAGGTVADWRERMLAETWYTGAEAVEAGLADEVTGADPQPADGVPMDRTWDLNVFAYAGRPFAPPPVPVDRSPRAAATPTESAAPSGEPAPVRPAPPVDTPAETPVEHPAPALGDAGDPAPTAPTQPAAPTEPLAEPPTGGDQHEDEPADAWDNLVAQLANDPALSTLDDALARLREAPL